MKITGRKFILSEKDNASQESFDRVLRKFKKLTRCFVKRARECSVFEKPSLKKRKKRIANQRNNKRNK